MDNLHESFKATLITSAPILSRCHDRQTPPEQAAFQGEDWDGVEILAVTPTNSGILLANPAALPVREIHTINRQRVLIVAPHPDDETLGCGGAISLLCRHGYDVNVLIISDGTASHPNSRKYPAPMLRWIRAQETLTALAILGVNRSAVTFAHIKDGAIPSVTAPKFHAVKVHCRNYLAANLPDTIFVPWRLDPHPDHRATWQLIKAAILSLEMTPRVIEYPIWDWDAFEQTTADLSQITGWRLDIQSVLIQKIQAIESYQSQLGQLIDDDPQGFCLSAEMLANFTRPWEVYFEEFI